MSGEPEVFVDYFTSCTCMAKWWPMFKRMLAHRGLPIPRVSQGSYSTSVSASASTHAGGGVIDMATTSQATDDLAETMGAASYIRTAADGFTPHTHLILTGCPHLHRSAQRQVASWMDMRNALVSNRPDRDTTRPPTWRTYAEGIVWARAQLTPQPSEEDDMLADQDILDPYDRKGTIKADKALSDAARYGFLALQAVGKLAGAFGAYVAAEKGADSAISQQVAAVAADLDALAAHLGQDDEVTA